MSADHALTISEYEALLRLSHADENAMRRVDLARELMLTPSGVTRLLDGLERAGYVEKGVCDSDARVTYAVLTAPGRKKIEQASRTHLEQVDAVVAEHFTAAEQRTLAELLGRLSGDVDTSECSAG
jgi:DNA-binding MarR family transcriptional regulator